MLTRWSIENFKSFRSRSDIELGRITIFAGANSSGKSTIIQSILAIKQTLEYAPISRVLALNGPIVKLGTYSDVLHANSEGSQIGISWKLGDLSPGEMHVRRVGYGQGFPRSYYMPYISGGGDMVSVDCRLQFSLPRQGSSSYSAANADTLRDVTQLYPALASVRVSALVAEEQENEHNQERERIAEIHLSLPSSSQFGPRTENESRALASDPVVTTHYDVEYLDASSQAEILESHADTKIVGATLRHFLPAQVQVTYDLARDKAKKIAALVCERSTYTSTRLLREYQDTDIPETVLTLIRQKIPDIIFEQMSLFAQLSSAKSIRLDKLMESMRELKRGGRPPHLAGAAAKIDLSELQPKIEEVLVNTFSKAVGTDLQELEEIEVASSIVSDFFTSSVRYLGPLRDEPRPIYPLEALADPTDVGYRGEHTAAVLDLHKDTLVAYMPPLSVETKNVGPSHQRTASLHDAVVDWLSYLGVAENVYTGDSGKIGHQLQVKTSGINSIHDLTNVGVGVSQVLPIVVMALISDSSSMLIFEQPELHLHPKVQARLADFFVSLSIVGKQCIVETHSEYLIDRLRRRVAEAPGDSLQKSVRIYFTERQNGETRCRNIPVSEFGAISEWPEDFFDQSQRESEMIVRAGIEKRRNLQRD